jgi:hypothetical protein
VFHLCYGIGGGEKKEEKGQLKNWTGFTITNNYNYCLTNPSQFSVKSIPRNINYQKREEAVAEKFAHRVIYFRVSTMLQYVIHTKMLVFG